MAFLHQRDHASESAVVVLLFAVRARPDGPLEERMIGGHRNAVATVGTPPVRFLQRGELVTVGALDGFLDVFGHRVCRDELVQGAMRLHQPSNR
jgi:hypothetical protein